MHTLFYCLGEIKVIVPCVICYTYYEVYTWIYVTICHTIVHAVHIHLFATQMWRCKSSYCSNVAKLSGYVDVKSQSEDDLLDAVSNVGPVW